MLLNIVALLFPRAARESKSQCAKYFSSLCLNHICWYLIGQCRPHGQPPNQHGRSGGAHFYYPPGWGFGKREEGKGQKSWSSTFYSMDWVASGTYGNRIFIWSRDWEIEVEEKKVERKVKEEGKRGVNWLPNRGQVRKRIKRFIVFIK